MSITPQNITSPVLPKHDEHILVVKRSLLFSSEPAWYGIKNNNLEHYLTVIREQQEFLPRSFMENDPNYKQIIPYLIFEHDNRYFLMQRKADSTESRLQNKYSLGIGGHVRQEDIVSGDIMQWAEREFHEEINYNGIFSVETLGLLNDDTNAVGQVHAGLVVIVHGNSSAITIKSELKQGHLMTLQECATFYDVMESWSQLVFKVLTQRSSF